MFRAGPAPLGNANFAKMVFYFPFSFTSYPNRMFLSLLYGRWPFGAIAFIFAPCIR
jgi:hypothetical protein